MHTTADPVPNIAAEIAAGDLITTTELARLEGLSPSAVFRWIQRGLPGANGHRVKLLAIRRGKTWLTSRAALARFYAALPSNVADDEPEGPAFRTPSQRVRESEAAAAELKSRYGV